MLLQPVPLHKEARIGGTALMSLLRLLLLSAFLILSTQGPATDLRLRAEDAAKPVQLSD